MPPPSHTPVAEQAKKAPTVRLPSELLDLVDSISRTLNDVETHQLPQLAGCKGPVSLHEQLAADVRAEIARVRRDLEELKLQTDELERERERKAAGVHVDDIERQLDGVGRLYRDAVLRSKRLIDSQNNLSAREELLHRSQARHAREMSRSQNNSTPSGQPKTADEALLSATSDVTEGLRRTMQLMQTELDKSVVSSELLQSQTQTLRMTSEEYSTFSSLLNTSKQLITALQRADTLDRLIILAALVFFGLCCSYIIKRRILDRGIRLAGALSSVVSRGSSSGSKVPRSELAGTAEGSGLVGTLRHHAVAGFASLSSAAGIIVSRIGKRANITTSEDDDDEQGAGSLLDRIAEQASIAYQPVAAAVSSVSERFLSPIGSPETAGREGDADEEEDEDDEDDEEGEDEHEGDDHEDDEEEEEDDAPIPSPPKLEEIVTSELAVPTADVAAPEPSGEPRRDVQASDQHVERGLVDEEHLTEPALDGSQIADDFSDSSEQTVLDVDPTEGDMDLKVPDDVLLGDDTHIEGDTPTPESIVTDPIPIEEQLPLETLVEVVDLPETIPDGAEQQQQFQHEHQLNDTELMDALLGAEQAETLTADQITPAAETVPHVEEQETIETVPEHDVVVPDDALDSPSEEQPLEEAQQERDLRHQHGNDAGEAPMIDFPSNGSFVDIDGQVHQAALGAVPMPGGFVDFVDQASFEPAQPQLHADDAHARSDDPAQPDEASMLATDDEAEREHVAAPSQSADDQVSESEPVDLLDEALSSRNEAVLPDDHQLAGDDEGTSTAAADIVPEVNDDAAADEPQLSLSPDAEERVQQEAAQADADDERTVSSDEHVADIEAMHANEDDAPVEPALDAMLDADGSEVTDDAIDMPFPDTVSAADSPEPAEVPSMTATPAQHVEPTPAVDASVFGDERPLDTTTQEEAAPPQTADSVPGEPVQAQSDTPVPTSTEVTIASAGVEEEVHDVEDDEEQPFAFEVSFEHQDDVEGEQEATADMPVFTPPAHELDRLKAKYAHGQEAVERHSAVEHEEL